MPHNMSDSKVVKCLKRADKAATPALLEAYKTLKNQKFTTEWMDEEEAMNVQDRERTAIFVVDPFEGQAFENLHKTKNRVYGPQCILSCLQNSVPIPKAEQPVYNIAMRGLVISCTSLTKPTREEIHSKIVMMGGEVSKDFTEHVTHLVAGEVGSKKYIVAANLNKAVMLPDWVYQVWARSQDHEHSNLRATDEEFSKFKCPVFKGLVVTVSGFDSVDRKELQKSVEENGGRYSGEMRIDECTHLIINEPKGQKYEFAKKWKIHIVTSAWAFQSIKKGFCLDESLYRPEDHRGDISQLTSTPTKGKSCGRLSVMSDVSEINNVSIASHINETYMGTTFRGNITKTFNESDPLDDLDITQVKGDMFLDGCKIFLSGFDKLKLEKLRKIINIGGGTRFNQINECVSHVVMGDRQEDHVAILQQADYRPHVVSVAWLIKSFENGRPEPEDSYRIMDIAVNDVMSPQPKPKKDGSHISAKTKASETPQHTTSKSDIIPDQDIMSQYLPQANQDSVSDSALLQVADGRTTDVDPDQTMDPDKTMTGDGIFSRKSFIICEFEPEHEEELGKMIKENGGEVLSGNSRQVPNYAVVPIFGTRVSVTVDEVVTNAWMQMCLEYDQLLEVSSNPLFTPVTLVADITPLQDCVLSISGYQGCERDCLMHIAELLGARCQEFFVKKPKDNLLANTHLLVNKPEGSKYSAALRWKFPAVSSGWLFACIRAGKRVDEKNYLVKNQVEGGNIPQERINSNTSVVSNVTLKEQEVKSSSSADETIATEAEACDKTRKDEAAENVMRQLPNKTPVSIKTTNKDTSNKENKDFKVMTPSVPTRTPIIKGHHTASLESGTSTFVTPKPVNARLKSLKNDLQNSLPRPNSQSHRNYSPVTNSPSVKRAGVDTPGKFLNPDKEYQPSFDLEDAYATLATPPGSRVSNANGRRRSSLPFDEVFGKHMAQALKNSAVPEAKSEHLHTESEQDDKVFREPAGPLKGVVIAVSKKLSAQQSEYNNMAASLGADYRWTYDSSCTHFIFKGRTNDTTKEFRLARDQGKIIVSPHWLLLCQEKKTRVDESLYPHNYNPSLTLSVVSSKRETPRRTPKRKTRASKNSQDDEPVFKEIKTAESSKLCRSIGQQEKSRQSETNTINSKKPSTGDAVSEKIDVTDGKEETNINDTTNSKEDSKDDAGDQGDGTGSLELREELSKQLENIMAVTMPEKQMKKVSRKSLSSADNSVDTSIGNNRSRPSSRLNKNNHPEVHSEPSQSVQVTWDDVEGRLEHERLAEELIRVYNPTQSCGQVSPRHSAVQTGQDANDSVIIFKNADTVATPVSTKMKQRTETATPEPPPIAFPLPKRPSAAAESAPVEILPDGAADAEEEEDVQTIKKVPVFQLSGLSPEERDDYGALIEELGGQISETQTYDQACTHLVVGTPTRNEKFLAAVATGKWVLHKSYFQACRAEGRFVNELDHEWGSEATEAVMASLPEQVQKLSAAAHRWRLQIQTRKKENLDYTGAFEGWRVILITDEARQSRFKRLLESGGGKVLPFSSKNLMEVTHAFLDLAKVKEEVNIEHFLEAGIKCLKPEYIASYLMEVPSPPVDAYIIPEIRQMQKSGKRVDALDTSKKRKPSSGSSNPATKRTRHH